MRRSLTNFARMFEGNIPYKYGGKNPAQAIDCSGFTQFVYSLYDLLPPMHIRMMGCVHQVDHFDRAGYAVGRPYEGVAVFYHKPRSWHVMICLDTVFCIGASGDNVIIRPINYRSDIYEYYDPFKRFGDQI